MHDHAGHEGHGHHHHHGVPEGGFKANRAFAIAVFLNIGMTVAELIFGVISGSMALIADAGHNFSDVIGIVMAWGAAWLAQRPANARFTFGYRRSTILAALGSGLLLMLASGGIAYEAVSRLMEPDHVKGWIVIIVAGIGVVINSVSAMLFMGGAKDDINIKGALLHLAGDAAVSVGVVISGVLILLFEWYWLDPVLSLVIVVFIVWATWGLLRDAVMLSLDAVPGHIDIDEVRGWLSDRPDVAAVHDLHIWALSTTQNAVTVHVVASESGLGRGDALLADLTRGLRESFKLHHATIQVERGDEAFHCDLCSLEEQRLAEKGEHHHDHGHEHEHGDEDHDRHGPKASA